ncbi:hypothetical protein BUALT_Bualt13G0037600 [Buddleja alternifolia]|uniref:Alkyl transferase n=1 Tax=Buddleja alternifolia TaxID=168488 RepID=A0AAV6WIL2_9LAMI|nr:hypothetical protein BUALT_Bualt13G0037600 [Buddleja alternifolia]
MQMCLRLPTTSPLPIKTVISSSNHFSSLKLCSPQNKIGDKQNISRYRLAATSNSTANAGFDDLKSAIQLPGDLRPEIIPKHVALIMDGHGRWAKNRGLPIEHAHYAGVQKLKQLILNCSQFGIKVLTVQDLRFSVIGDKSSLPQSVQSTISSVENSTKTNTGMHFLMALSYGGRYDIIEATKKIASKVEHGILRAEDINESAFEQQLLTNVTEFPNPDLLIRTSGELRVSNFLLWQLAYTEFYFPNKLFPDFEEADLIEALNTFRGRQRNFGGRNK